MVGTTAGVGEVYVGIGCASSPGASPDRQCSYMSAEVIYATGEHSCHDSSISEVVVIIILIED